MLLLFAYIFQTSPTECLRKIFKISRRLEAVRVAVVTKKRFSEETTRLYSFIIKLQFLNFFFIFFSIMKTLFNICLSYISRNLELVGDVLCLPGECKEHLLEWLVSHDHLSSPYVPQLITDPIFVRSLQKVSFYLSDEVTDELLIELGTMNKHLLQVSVVYCNNVGDRGVRAMTEFQPVLTKLELKGLKLVTSYGIAGIVSDELKVVDLSDCPNICSSGIVHLVTHNRNIQKIYLNSCKALDDLAVYAIGAHLGSNLRSLELDFMDHLQDPSAAITYLTERCPNLMQMSLCRYFGSGSNSNFFHLECTIKSDELRELDLFGNFFLVLPKLPRNIVNLRLSCTGSENVQDLIDRLKNMQNLNEIRLTLTSRESSDTAVQTIHDFLELFLPACGSKIVGLQIMAYHLKDSILKMISDTCLHLVTLSLNVQNLSAFFLHQLFHDQERARGLKSLKFSRLKLPYKVLCTIAKLCVSLEEVEVSFMECVDDRFLKLLAGNCKKLKNVNFNGCQFVSDKGVCAIARNCPLREIRLRATTVTDKCVYVLAQYCPELEWIAHADYKGKPKFSENALQALRDNCVQRVIC